jgi:carboxypeptidase family protein
MRLVRFVLPVCVLAIVFHQGTLLAAQSDAIGSIVIDGRTVDIATGEPLPGADVIVNDGQVRTATDRDGRFRMVNVSAGMVIVSILPRTEGRVLTEALSPQAGAGYRGREMQTR